MAAAAASAATARGPRAKMENVTQEAPDRFPETALNSGSLAPDRARSAPRLADNEYAELKRLVTEKGLLRKQPGYYARLSIVVVSLLALSLTLLVLVDVLWLQLLNAVFLAFVFAQLGFIGHDLGHRQVFNSARKTKITGLAVSFLLGTSRTWWIEKHNQHHNNPNQLDADPDIIIPVLAFSESQAREKRGVLRFIIRHQGFFFFPVLALEGIGLRLASFNHMVRTRKPHIVPEALFTILHFTLYFGLIFTVLGVWQAIAFIAIHQAFFGLYVGTVFATNHKGMPILDKDTRMDFLRRQVITSRNVEGSPAVDFWYAGLNFQIEHHLFPNMPRNKLPEARKIVKAFCKDHSISYYESSMPRSYVEIVQHMHQVGIAGTQA